MTSLAVQICKSSICETVSSNLIHLMFFFNPFSVDTPTQNRNIVGRTDGTSPDVGTDHHSCASILQDSSFEVISLESR